MSLSDRQKARNTEFMWIPSLLFLLVMLIKTDEQKRKMELIYREHIQELSKLVSDFVITSADSG